MKLIFDVFYKKKVSKILVFVFIFFLIFFFYFQLKIKTIFF